MDDTTVLTLTDEKLKDLLRCGFAHGGLEAAMSEGACRTAYRLQFKAQ